MRTWVGWVAAVLTKVDQLSFMALSARSWGKAGIAQTGSSSSQLACNFLVYDHKLSSARPDFTGHCFCLPGARPALLPCRHVQV